MGSKNDLLAALELAALAEYDQPGDSVELTIDRDGQPTKVSVTPGQQ